MQIYGNKLEQHLSEHGLSPIYIIASDEPFWHEDAGRTIVNFAKSRGFTSYNYNSFSTDSIDLELLEDSCGSPGLFAENSLVVLSVPAINKSKGLREALAILERCLNPSLLAIVNTPRLSKADLGSGKPFGKLAAKGLAVIFYPLRDYEYTKFINDRARAFGLSLDPQGTALILSSYQGNLFAMVQTLEKISLSGKSGYVTADEIRWHISPENHFSVYDLQDALINPSLTIERRLVMIDSLRQEGTPMMEIIGQFGQALQDLYRLRTLMDRNQPLNSFFEGHRILKFLPQKRTVYQKAAQGLTAPALRHLMDLICRADLAVRNFDEKTALMLIRETAAARSCPSKIRLNAND